MVRSEGKANLVILCGLLNYGNLIFSYTCTLTAAHALVNVIT